jgi:hypothetical protein
MLQRDFCCENRNDKWPLETLEVMVVESGGNFEDYNRFLSCHVLGPVNHGQNWKGWDRSGEKDSISDTCKNKTRLKGLILIILSTYQA